MTSRPGPLFRGAKAKNPTHMGPEVWGRPRGARVTLLATCSQAHA